jgi:hypothetical protein
MTDDITPPVAPNLTDVEEEIFALPGVFAQNETYVRWYTEIRDRLRRESRGVPMKTVQLLLQHRIALGFLLQRIRDEGDENAPRVTLEMEKLWLSQVQEFNRTLEKNQDRIINDVLVQVSDIMREVLPLVTNKEEQRALREALIVRFNEIEL